MDTVRELMRGRDYVVLEAAPSRVAVALGDRAAKYGSADRSPTRCWTPYLQAVVRRSEFSAGSAMWLFCRTTAWSEDDPAVCLFPWPNICTHSPGVQGRYPASQRSGVQRFQGHVDGCGGWTLGATPRTTDRYLAAVGVLNAYFTSGFFHFSVHYRPEEIAWAKRWMPAGLGPPPRALGNGINVSDVERFFRRWSRLSRAKVLDLAYLECYPDLREAL